MHSGAAPGHTWLHPATTNAKPLHMHAALAIAHHQLHAHGIWLYMHHIHTTTTTNTKPPSQSPHHFAPRAPTNHAQPPTTHRMAAQARHACCSHKHHARRIALAACPAGTSPAHVCKGQVAPPLSPEQALDTTRTSTAMASTHRHTLASILQLPPLPATLAADPSRHHAAAAADAGLPQQPSTRRKGQHASLHRLRHHHIHHTAHAALLAAHHLASTTTSPASLQRTQRPLHA